MQPNVVVDRLLSKILKAFVAVDVDNASEDAVFNVIYNGVTYAVIANISEGGSAASITEGAAANASIPAFGGEATVEPTVKLLNDDTQYAVNELTFEGDACTFAIYNSGMMYDTGMKYLVAGDLFVCDYIKFDHSTDMDSDGNGSDEVDTTACGSYFNFESIQIDTENGIAQSAVVVSQEATKEFKQLMASRSY